MIEWKIPEDAVINCYLTALDQPRHLLIYKLDADKEELFFLLLDKVITVQNVTDLAKIALEMPDSINEVSPYFLYVYYTDVEQYHIYNSLVLSALAKETVKG